MNEIDYINEFIKSPAFALMSEEVKHETLSKQYELAKVLVDSKIKEILSPILDKYNLEIVYEIKKKQQQYDKVPRTTEVTKQTKSTNLRTPQKGLCVILSNGNIIQENKAADTFAKSIKFAGPSKVKTLGLILDKENIILQTNNKPLPFNLHDVGGGYYVNSHSNTASKQRMLEKISKALKLGWKVDIIE